MTDKDKKAPGWKVKLTPIHQAPAIAAKVVRHGIPRCDSLGHSEAFDFILAPYVLQRSIANREIRRKHRCGKLAAIDTVADKLFSYI